MPAPLSPTGISGRPEDEVPLVAPCHRPVPLHQPQGRSPLGLLGGGPLIGVPFRPQHRFQRFRSLRVRRHHHGELFAGIGPQSRTGVHSGRKPRWGSVLKGQSLGGREWVLSFLDSGTFRTKMQTPGRKEGASVLLAQVPRVWRRPAFVSLYLSRPNAQGMEAWEVKCIHAALAKLEPSYFPLPGRKGLIWRRENPENFNRNPKTKTFKICFLPLLGGPAPFVLTRRRQRPHLKTIQTFQTWQLRGRRVQGSWAARREFASRRRKLWSLFARKVLFQPRSKGRPGDCASKSLKLHPRRNRPGGRLNQW